MAQPKVLNSEPDSATKKVSSLWLTALSWNMAVFC